MSERSVTHATFALERTYPASPARVFAAFADPAAKRAWFVGPEEWQVGPYELEFRVGGRERASGGPAGGPVHTYEAQYHDIVPNERIVLAYAMYADELRTSISLGTWELRPAAGGTRVLYTEQSAFLDGSDDGASREHGTRVLLDQLGDILTRQPV
jgi:uncharacterized protein YndB with AHSA1/START domain